MIFILIEFVYVCGVSKLCLINKRKKDEGVIDNAGLITICLPRLRLVSLSFDW